MSNVRTRTFASIGKDASRPKRPASRPNPPPKHSDLEAEGVATTPWWDSPASTEAPSRASASGMYSSGTQSNGTRSYQLGGKTFQASEDMTSYFRKILNKTRTGAFLPHGEHALVMELLQRGHRNAKEKVGPGVSGVTVLPHPQFQDTRCFHLVRVDGTYADFSYRKCVRHITERVWDAGFVQGTRDLGLSRCQNIEQVYSLLEDALECIDGHVLAQALRTIGRLGGMGRGNGNGTLALQGALLDRRYLKVERMVAYAMDNASLDSMMDLLDALSEHGRRPTGLLEVMAENMLGKLPGMGKEQRSTVLQKFGCLGLAHQRLLERIDFEQAAQAMVEGQRLGQSGICDDLMGFAILDFYPTKIVQVVETWDISKVGPKETAQLLWALAALNMEESGLFEELLRRMDSLIHLLGDSERFPEEEESFIAHTVFLLGSSSACGSVLQEHSLKWAKRHLGTPLSLNGLNNWQDLIAEGLRSLGVTFTMVIATPFDNHIGFAINTLTGPVLLIMRSSAHGGKELGYVQSELIGQRILESKGWKCVVILRSEWEECVRSGTDTSEISALLRDRLLEVSNEASPTGDRFYGVE